ncbi:MAG: ABC transporter permease [Acidimicrobiales bacterium]
MDEFLGLTVLGLCTASVYGLAASGLVLTYTTTGIFNFAHGAIGMLGAFAFWELHTQRGWPIPLALVAVLLVLAPGLGVLIERLIMRHLTDAPETVRVVVTISLLVALLGLGLWWWPSDEAHPPVQLFRGEVLDVLGVGVSWHRASAVVVAIVVVVALRGLLFRTRVGLDMRASVDSRPLAMLHGARPDRSAALAWAIGSSLAALAGILIAPVATMNHIALTIVIVSAYAAAMFGRLRSLPLTIVGALVLGLLESYAIGYIDSGQQYFATFRFAIAPIVLSIVLLALPSALLRTRSGLASKEDIPRPSWGGALATAGAIVVASLVLASILSNGDAIRAAKVLGLAMVALSLVPLTGFGGQVSLCQMSFAGIGAIVMGHHGADGNPATLLLVAVVCAVAGALVALPSLRLSGLYLALSTAAFAVFLDRWGFGLPPFDLGPFGWGGGDPVRVRLFDNVLPVRAIDVPGLDDSGRPAQLVVLAVLFALLYLVVVAVRRSGFGERLLAMKDSPAACATVGINVTALKLAVFSLSAAIAGVGGAVYAGTLGSVTPDRFSLFESLPLLLLGVVGGIGTAGGALFAGIILGGLPIAIAVWPFLENLNRLLPGTMGIALGRNPNGAVRDIAERYAVLRSAPVALVGIVASVTIAAILAVTGSLTGWGLTFGLVIALVVWPQVAEQLVARRAPRQGTASLEWAGIDRPLGADELRDIDAALGLEAPREQVPV